MSGSAEIWTDPTGKRWKIVTLPDPSGGETVLVIEARTADITPKPGRTTPKSP